MRRARAAARQGLAAPFARGAHKTKQLGRRMRTWGGECERGRARGTVTPGCRRSLAAVVVVLRIFGPS